MEFDTIFRLRSMTKPITSAAVMMLYEEGHFQLYDPVSEFIPAFRDGKVHVATTLHCTVLPKTGALRLLKDQY